MKWNRIILWAPLFLTITSFANGEQAARNNNGMFRNYQKSINIIKSNYEDPWITEIDNDPLYSIQGLRFIQAGEKKYLNEDPFYPDDWIITRTGKVFRADEIESALHEIKYVPADGSDAERVGVIIVQRKSTHCNIITATGIDITATGIDSPHVPADLQIQAKPPQVINKDSGYTVIVYASCYLEPCGFGMKPTNSQLRTYEIEIVKDNYLVKEKEVVSASEMK